MTSPPENHRFSPLSVSTDADAETSTPLVSRVLPQYPYEQYVTLHTQHVQRHVQRLSRHFAHNVLVESDTDKWVCVVFLHAQIPCVCIVGLK